MKYLVFLLALVVCYASESKDCDVRNGDCSHNCRMAGNGKAICSCPHGWSMAGDGHNCIENDPECHAVPLSLKTLTHNNLGGLGPDKGGEEAIVYSDALELDDGTVLEVVISAGEIYVPADTSYNGIAPGDEFGQIGVKSGTGATILVTLRDQKTKKAYEVPWVHFTVYDLDREKHKKGSKIRYGQESVRFCNANRFLLTSTTTLGIESHEYMCSKFAAQMWGNFDNNPTTRAELTEEHMDHAITAVYKNTDHFYAHLETTKAKKTQWSRQYIFSMDVDFCESPRCRNPVTRPEHYLEITPIMKETKYPPGKYFQFKRHMAENFFNTRPKWDYFGQHTMMNSCGETQMLTIIRHGQSCDVGDDTIECGRFSKWDFNKFDEPDWNYVDFDGHKHRWISWVPGEEPEYRACKHVKRPERSLTIHPIEGEGFARFAKSRLQDAMYFYFDDKEAKTFFAADPSWNYKTSETKFMNSCGEIEELTIMRNAKGCTDDGKKWNCGRISDMHRAGFDDWNYENHPDTGEERWIAYPDDVILEEALGEDPVALMERGVELQ